MTRFDTVESQAPAATLDTAQLTGAKLQADYLSGLTNSADTKFTQVADTKIAQAQSPADSAGEQAPQQKDPIKSLIADDPKDLPPSLQPLQGLAGHFDKADDKSKALAEVKAPVEKTIADIDSSSAATNKQIEAEAKVLAPQIKAVEAALNTAKPPLQEAFKQVPQEDQKHVAAEIGLLVDDKTKPALKHAIEADLGSYAGLVPAIEAMSAAQKAAQPVAEKVNELQAKQEEAKDEQIFSRMIYADMLKQGGDEAGAKKVNAESMALQMGMTIEQFRAMQQKQQSGAAPASAGDKN